MEDEAYEGWTNIDTWAAALWLDNERDLQEWAQKQTMNAPTIDCLAEKLKPFTTSKLPRDFVNGGIDFSVINWWEMAEHLFLNWDRIETPDYSPLQSSIARMIINGHRLELPQDVFFDNYKEVRDAMQKAGGKYKKNGFIFEDPAQLIYDRFLAGEKMNKKQEFQFFETPEDVVWRLQELAFCGKEVHSILEPSAGRGRLIKNLKPDRVHIDCVELDPHNIPYLEALGVNVMCGDFMEFKPAKKYDLVIANPPFTKGQDVEHVTKMLDHCKPGGRVVSVMSTSWRTRTGRKFEEFRDLIETMGGEIVDIAAGAFKESGTMVQTCIVCIDIPEAVSVTVAPVRQVRQMEMAL